MSKVNVVQNLLSVLKLGYIGKKEYIYCKSSKFLLEILNLFLKQNIIRHYIIVSQIHKVKIYLRYYHNFPIVKEFSLINKPSLKIYCSYESLNYYKKKFDIFILSTNKGLITSSQLENSFKKKNLKCGGQILFGLKYNNFKLH